MFTKFSNAFRNALVGLTVVGAVSALTLPASAASQGSYAGFVTAAGAVTSSNPFTGVRTGIGSYTITAPQSIFSTFPVMTVTPFGINAPTWFRSWTARSAAAAPARLRFRC